jgi:hypothetical protein
MSLHISAKNSDSNSSTTCNRGWQFPALFFFLDWQFPLESVMLKVVLFMYVPRNSPKHQLPQMGVVVMYQRVALPKPLLLEHRNPDRYIDNMEVPAAKGHPLGASH